MADEDELAAAHRSVEEMREQVGATSLAYLSLDGMQWATRLPEERTRILDEFYDRYQRLVAAAPQGHGMDYIHIHLVCVKE